MFDYTPNSIVIPLTQGQFTIVDATYADLAELKWTAQFSSSYANGGGYRAIHKNPLGNGKRETWLLHRVIMERVLNRKLLRTERIDHIDLNPLNNLVSNLRLSTPTQNGMNRRKQSNNTSGYKGVTRYKNSDKWRAQITIDGIVVNLGHYDTPEEAYRAYCDAARREYGTFALLE